MNRAEARQTWDDAKQRPPGRQVGPYWLSLSYGPGRPRQFYLSVDGGNAYKISVRDLSVYLNFEIWFRVNGYVPPIIKKDEFKEIIRGLEISATECPELAPYLRSDAIHIENLVRFFNINIPPKVRSLGQEFLDGKGGKSDLVRVRMDLRRIYFKWPNFKSHLERMGVKDQHIDEMRTFIDERGGYQDQHHGRDWWRCTLWLPMDLFDEVTLEKWFDPDKKEEES